MFFCLFLTGLIHLGENGDPSGLVHVPVSTVRRTGGVGGRDLHWVMGDPNQSWVVGGVV